MKENLEALVSTGSEPLSPQLTLARLPAAVRKQAGALGQELLEMLKVKNGFFAFDRALHVFPLGTANEGYDLVTWNSDELWRTAYGHLLAGRELFFAEDIFGEQFLIREDTIWRFDPETGDQEAFADTLDDWAYRILDEDHVEVGTLFANDWTYLNGPLDAKMRLVPRRLFTLGGAFELENLLAADAVKAMRFRGDFAQQVHDLPDGTEIELELTDEQDL